MAKEMTKETQAQTSAQPTIGTMTLTDLAQVVSQVVSAELDRREARQEGEQIISTPAPEKHRPHIQIVDRPGDPRYEPYDCPIKYDGGKPLPWLQSWRWLSDMRRQFGILAVQTIKDDPTVRAVAEAQGYEIMADNDCRPNYRQPGHVMAIRRARAANEGCLSRDRQIMDEYRQDANATHEGEGGELSGHLEIERKNVEDLYSEFDVPTLQA